MSDPQDRSAIDALVEQNMSLRDEVDELIDERDEARRTAEANPSAAPSSNGSSGGRRIGFAGEQPDGADADAGDFDELDVEALVAERDSFLADSQRLAADFANYRKQADKRVVEAAAAQSASLIRNLLPVLDACDKALEHDPESPVAPIRAALLSELERSGLSLLAPEVGEPFDPELHEAVMHEVDADTDDDEHAGSRVSEVFRAGYVWKGRVVRPAMVKVVG